MSKFYDIDKQLDGNTLPVVDTEQLNWLQERLIAPGKILMCGAAFFSSTHPPYVTESTKWCQGPNPRRADCTWRQVLDAGRCRSG